MWKLPITRASVLVLQDAKRAMHYKEITQALLDRGLIASRSPSVQRCVYSGMSKHIRERAQESWFRHEGRGIYGLTRGGRELEVWRHAPDLDEGVRLHRKPRLDMSWREAATRTLAEAREPLHAQEVVRRIWSKGYRPAVDGATPYRTIGNLLATMARERNIRRVGPGTYKA